MAEWYAALWKNDKGFQKDLPWFLPNIDTSDWLTMDIPGYWFDRYPDIQNGSVWFRKSGNSGHLAWANRLN